MALPSSFQARVQEMEDNRHMLLERLQAEKALHKRKCLQLSKQHEILAKIKQRCLVLKQKDAELSVKVLEKEEEVRTADEKLGELHVKRRTLQSDLDELEHREQERSEFYKQKKNMMDVHQCRMHDYMLSLKTEVEELRKTFLQVVQSPLAPLCYTCNGVCFNSLVSICKTLDGECSKV